MALDMLQVSLPDGDVGSLLHAGPTRAAEEDEAAGCHARQVRLQLLLKCRQSRTLFVTRESSCRLVKTNAPGIMMCTLIPAVMLQISANDMLGMDAAGKIQSSI